MDGFNPLNPPGTRVGSIDQPLSVESSVESSEERSHEYRRVMPRPPLRSSGRELSERTVGMPSSAMTGRYAQIRSGIAGLADDVRGFGLTLSSKEKESLRSFLMLLDGGHVESLAQYLEELLMTTAIPADKSEDLRARVSLIRTRLQRAGRNEHYGFNDAQLLFTKIKDDLKVVSNVLEAAGSSSNTEKAAMLGAFHQIQEVESKIAMFVASAQDDYHPMLAALKQMQNNLNIVELGLNSLNPVGTYGIVASSVDHSTVEVPPCGKPELAPPEVCDLQRSVFDLRARMELLQKELGKKNVKPQVCRQQVSGLMGRLESLAEDAALLERTSIEVHEKACTSVSLAQIMRGLEFLRVGLGEGGRGLLSGLSKLFGHGQVLLGSVSQCCGGFTHLLNNLVSGFSWSAKGLGYYAGVAMLTPLFLVKKLAEDHEPWWSQPLPVNDFPNLPEGMEVYDPLKSTDAFNAMYRYLKEREHDGLYLDREISVAPSTASFSEPRLPPMMPASEFTDSLQIHFESLRDLEDSFASESIGAVRQAQESLTHQKLEMKRLENDFERLSPQMTEPEKSTSQHSLKLCRELIDSYSSRSLTPQSMPYDSFGPNGSFVLLEDESITPSGNEFHQNVVQVYKEQKQLSALFDTAENVHTFLQQKMPILRRMVSEEELQLISVALERLKDQRLNEEAGATAWQAFERRFHGRFKQVDRDPSMKIDRDAVVSSIQDALVKEIDQVTGKLRDMLPREQMAIDNQDWQFIKEKACSMALLDTMKKYLDDPSMVRLNLHYFTGHDLSESEVELIIGDVNEKLENLLIEMDREKVLTRDKLEFTERRLDTFDAKLSQLKSKLADLYFEGVDRTRRFII